MVAHYNLRMGCIRKLMNLTCWSAHVQYSIRPCRFASLEEKKSIFEVDVRFDSEMVDFRSYPILFIVEPEPNRYVLRELQQECESMEPSD